MPLTVHGLEGFFAFILQGYFPQFVITPHVVLELLEPLAVHTLGHAQGGYADQGRQQGQCGRTQKIGRFWLGHQPERQDKERVEPDQKLFHRISRSQEQIKAEKQNFRRRRRRAPAEP